VEDRFSSAAQPARITSCPSRLESWAMTRRGATAVAVPNAMFA
jgi:hypothetical protein